MINGRPRPALSEAIETDSLNQIVRTLDYFSGEDTKKMNGRTMVLFTDGKAVILVDTSGYMYPRYKTPLITHSVYETMSDVALERLLKCKATGSEVDYVIGDKVTAGYATRSG
jgi:hypothetical protein